MKTSSQKAYEIYIKRVLFVFAFAFTIPIILGTVISVKKFPVISLSVIATIIIGLLVFFYLKLLHNFRKTLRMWHCDKEISKEFYSLREISPDEIEDAIIVLKMEKDENLAEVFDEFRYKNYTLMSEVVELLKGVKHLPV